MKISVFCGTSVDGFIARPDGALDFLEAGGSAPHGYEEFTATIDTIVIGRNTYETVLAFAAWPYGDDKRVVVLSSRAIAQPRGGHVEHLSGEPAEVAAKLSAGGAKHVYLDGGITIQRFLRAGQVDRIVVTRVPVLIGQGIPLFGSLPADVSLRHVTTRTFAGGLVQSEYLIERFN